MFPTTYAKLSSEVLSNLTEANAAAMTAVTTPGVSDREAGATPTEDVEAGEDHGDWETDIPTDGDADVGDSVTFTKTIHDEDVKRFAAASGDTNPLHLDDDFAEETRFDGRIAHGMLVSGLISAALARIPGDVVYLSQDLEFLAPVEIGDRVTADCEIVEDLGNDQYRLTTTVGDGEDVAVDGEAVVMLVGQ